ncbi:hypothetical protein L218DRAFT_438726 [Marasmius fiardii PR-910]|nr:hypothetical protein L218DRAFT_438726 [Marasmius fiardii PR-910]
MSILWRITEYHRLLHPDNPIFLDACCCKHAPRWVTYAVFRLMSPKRWEKYPVSGESAGGCVAKALEFLRICLDFDNFSILEALDAGILSSWYRHRDLIIDTSKGKAAGDMSNPAMAYSRLFNGLVRRRYHRPLMLRTTRSIRKISKREIDVSLYLKDCGPMLESWMRLCNEAAEKHGFSKGGLDGWYENAICGHSEASSLFSYLPRVSFTNPCFIVPPPRKAEDEPQIPSLLWLSCRDLLFI